MIIINIKNVLFELAECPSVSGDESGTYRKITEYLSKYMSVKSDALNNIIGENDGEGSHIMLEAHIDSIGMTVTEIGDNGFIRMDKCGGIDLRTLSAHDVVIHGKKDIYGVITSVPPHLAENSKSAVGFDEITVDTGLTHGEAHNFIGLGDRISFVALCREMLNNTVCGAYFDDKAGVCAVLRCLEILKEKNCSKKITVLFSSQEETGGSGAVAGGFCCDAQKSISVDVSFAKTRNTPVSITAETGKGTLIGYAPCLDYNFSNELADIAKSKNIPFQLEIMSGSTGTDADKLAISKGGRKAALLSIPLKNMHTPAEVVSIDDIEYTAQLMAEYILSDGGADL